MSLSLWCRVGKGSPFSSIRKVATAFVDASLSSAIPLLVDDGELKGKAKPESRPKLLPLTRIDVTLLVQKKSDLHSPARQAFDSCHVV